MSRLTISNRIRKIPIQLLVILISFVAIFPIYWMFNTALTTTSEMFLEKPKLWPNSLSLGGFANVFDELEIGLWIKNTFVIAFGSTVMSLILAIFAAYGLARRKFFGKGFFGFILFATQMLPEALLVVPLYAVFIKLSLINSLTGLVIVNTAFVMPIVIWVIKGAIDSVPYELEQAALIDGCSVFQIQRLIIWPLIAPSIVASAVLAFFHGWNEYLFATTFILDSAKRPASTGLATVLGELATDLEVVMAGAIIYTLPPIIFFMLIQKRIVAGLSSGAIKG
jgi:multiple sugar transport system permease protein